MNIKEAKAEIKNAMTAYFTKDKFGDYKIPIEKQRPVFLMGPPGIGKTAIMEQIAEELDVALVSYSMTHHTRQSALGLPFIETKTYGGKEYSVSEYTMSEIIASVYDMMEETGKEEGILFLDEINCVSETLAPSMLQFLQYKVFGRHQVPKGWIVVTAGNPMEYNDSVRDFDIVTWDRLKRIDCEADYGVWKEYAYKNGTHAAITSYLEIKKEDFYKVESTVDGKRFVTARGWSDLSDMICLYEENDLPVTEGLVIQYLQDEKIAKNFAIYYDLFNKYKSDYQVDEILAGMATPEIVERAAGAAFDERLSLLSLLIDGVSGAAKEVSLQEKSMTIVMNAMNTVKKDLTSGKNALQALTDEVDNRRENLKMAIKASAISAEDRYATSQALEMLKAMATEAGTLTGDEAMVPIRRVFAEEKEKLQEMSQDTKEKLSHVFAFCESAFGEGEEVLILVTELTINYHTAKFISRYGCDEYFKHNKELLFYERQRDIIKALDDVFEDLDV